MDKIEKEISSFSDYQGNKKLIKNKIDFDKYSKKKNYLPLKLVIGFPITSVILFTTIGINNNINNNVFNKPSYSIETRRRFTLFNITLKPQINWA